jgi:hypothetical protein
MMMPPDMWIVGMTETVATDDSFQKSSGAKLDALSLGRPGEIVGSGSRPGLVCDGFADAVHRRGIGETHAVGGQRAQFLKSVELGWGEGYETRSLQ